MRKTRSFRSAVIAALAFLFVWSAVALVSAKQQAIADWWQLRGYEPSIEIVQLADASSMTDKARHIFYVHRPIIEPAEDFNQHCRIENEFTIILGCYVQGQGIYIFDVEDERLRGIEEVTAAHEMLHAAYDRLSSHERASIDSLTQAYFETSASRRLKDTIQQYYDNTPASVSTELYAIIGTEIRVIPDELEEHYRQFFIDRSMVVQKAEDYERAFEERKQQIDRLTAQLTDLKAQIDTRSAALRSEGASLSAEYTRLERERATTTDAESYRQAAIDYNTRVERYNREVAAIGSLIDRHNALYAEYETVVLERQDLFNAIDSRPEALKSQ